MDPERLALERHVVTQVPPAAIEAGSHTGSYRIGGDAPLAEDGGHISAADLAGAVLDEIDSPAHVRRRFAVSH